MFCGDTVVFKDLVYSKDSRSHDSCPKNSKQIRSRILANFVREYFVLIIWTDHFFQDLILDD